MVWSFQGVTVPRLFWHLCFDSAQPLPLSSPFPGAVGLLWVVFLINLICSLVFLGLHGSGDSCRGSLASVSQSVKQVVITASFPEVPQWILSRNDRQDRLHALPTNTAGKSHFLKQQHQRMGEVFPSREQAASVIFPPPSLSVLYCPKTWLQDGPPSIFAPMRDFQAQPEVFFTLPWPKQHKWTFSPFTWVAFIYHS